MRRGENKESCIDLESSNTFRICYKRLSDDVSYISAGAYDGETRLEKAVRDADTDVFEAKLRICFIIYENVHEFITNDV